MRLSVKSSARRVSDREADGFIWVKSEGRDLLGYYRG